MTKEELVTEYTINGHSDREIAELYGMSRTAVVRARKKFGIPSRQSTGEIGELVAINILKKLRFPVRNMNDVDKLSPYDLLVDGSIRIDVKASSCIHQEAIRFQLSQKAAIGISANNHNYIILPNGRYRKDFTRTCDIVMLVGIQPIYAIYVIPSVVIPSDQQTITIGSCTGKWEIWKNRFDIMREMLKKPA